MMVLGEAHFRVLQELRGTLLDAGREVRTPVSGLLCDLQDAGLVRLSCPCVGESWVANLTFLGECVIRGR